MSMIRDAMAWIADKVESANKPHLLSEDRFYTRFYMPNGNIEEHAKQRPASIISVSDPVAFVKALWKLERAHLTIVGDPSPVVYINETQVVGYLGQQDLYHRVQLQLRDNPLWKQLESLHEKTFDQSQLVRFLRTHWRSVDTNGGMRTALAKIEVTRSATEKREVEKFRDKGMREFANEVREEIPELYMISCPVYDIPFADAPQSVEVVLDFDLSATPLTFRLFPRPECLLAGRRRALKQLTDLLRTEIDAHEGDVESTIGESTLIIHGIATEHLAK